VSSEWLKGKVAVVTGASQGVGRATAEVLGGDGAVVFAAARSVQSLEELSLNIRARGGHIVPVGCDVAQPDQVDALFARAEREDPVKVVVCAAGILEKATFAETSTETWQRVIGVNLTGTFLCCQRAFRSMRDSGGGRIVTIASLSGVYGTEKFPGLAAYNVSKFGVVGLTEAIAVEGRAHGISALCLSPGAVDTEMLKKANPDLEPGLRAEQVAKMIVALLDEAVAPASGGNLMLFSNQ
jgi:NAD(P)-dependent dehydrogenase (short-subunit alcohol dehydrogenase family)